MPASANPSSPLSAQRLALSAARRAEVAEAHAGWPARGGGAATTRARARLARALWGADGRRKLPGSDQLDRALSALAPDELAWICELSPLGPLYLLPTRRFAHRLAKQVRQLGVRRVVEVAAGDGFLTRSLRAVAPDLSVTATDSGAWEEPRARMSPAERRALRGAFVPGLALGSEVRALSAEEAVRTLAPELVLCAWLPPGHLLDALIRAPVRYVLEIGAGSGVTASAYAWRFAHEFLEGPLAEAARCRLDTRPARALHSRITLYYGAAHPEHFEDEVQKGDWLWQFRPRPSRRAAPSTGSGPRTRAR